MRRARALGLAVIATLLTSAAAHAAPGVLRVARTLTSPAPRGASTPRLAPGPGDALVLSWQEPRAAGGHRLRMAQWDDGRWSEPRTIAEGDSFFVNWADFPVVTRYARDRLIATWAWRVAGAPYAYHVRYAVSADDGRTWSAPSRLHRDTSATEHGFVSVADAGDHARVVWLDGHAYAGRAEGDPAAQMALHAARVDRDGRVSGEVTLDDRVCDCCGTAQSGTRVFYRDRGADEVRDLAVLDTAAPEAPRIASGDGWRIPGCPVNGPAATGAGVAFYTESSGGEDGPMVRHAWLGPDALMGARRIDLGRPLGRVAMAALPGGGDVAAWLEESGPHATLVARVLQRSGDAPALRVARVSKKRASGFPQLAPGPDGRIMLAWHDPDARRIRVVELAAGD